LDSFAYRSPLATRVRTFEVDHPTTQAWKRQQLAAAGIPRPDTVTFVPADLATDLLPDRLAEAGFDLSRPTLVTWLGVGMYLPGTAIDRTLAAIGGLAAGTELICDYMLPAGLRDAAADNYVELVAPVAAQHGEPWLTFLAPTEMSTMLTRHGFTSIRHIHQD